jgi:conjugative relaxase-like TrwC/TraI family protein
MIHPRRLKGKPGSLTRYYLVGDYYTKGADEPSCWGGQIAAELGLEGKVDPAIFQSLLAGKVAEQQLGRKRAGGEIDHHPGWDFAVNAPKSVSILALVAGDDQILVAHERAVTVALSYLEEHATLRHRSDGGIVHETTGRLIFARFTEHASRELDPHLHTHVVVMNMTNRGGAQPMASLETRAMFAEQMVAGQIYRNELAHALRENGYDIAFDPRSGLFEIEGVPRDLIETMSQRAGQIETHAREHGLTGQAARRQSFYETRKPKEKASLETLRERWNERLGEHREAVTFVRQQADQRGRREVAATAAQAARAMLFGIRHEEEREAVNNLGRLFGRALASHVGEVRLSDVRPLAEAHEGRRKLLDVRSPTGDGDLTRGRTTRRTARLELALSDHLALALSDAVPIANKDRLAAVSIDHGLNPAQALALIHIGSSDNRVVGVHGVAGAGKSTLIRALNAAKNPKTMLIALAPTSSAAANLGTSASIESRTVASLIAGGGRTLDDRHVLVIDEAGQLGNRQALRVLQISRETGARLVFLGDNRQTSAIDQGKAFWLMQRLGLSFAELPDSVRQETKAMKAAVTQARLHNYAASLDNLDKVTSGEGADRLAERLVEEWTHLKSDNRTKTNILVLENTTRLIVNARIREALKAEGAIAAQDTPLTVLTPTGLSDQEKRLARFYRPDQVLIFSRDHVEAGIAREAEYRVVALGRSIRGRQTVQLVDEQGRMIDWDPRLGRGSRVNVFNREQRDLAAGDRIQWRLVNRALDLRNADRGTVERLDGAVAFIRWDREGRTQHVDLLRHKNWDHGYAETVFASQSKTYDRVYVLAPVNSPLVTAQTYYTAITRARFGAKLWTEDEKRLVERLERRSGEKTSALEGLGRIDRSSVRARTRRLGPEFEALRVQQRSDRADRAASIAEQRSAFSRQPAAIAGVLAGRARALIVATDRWIASLLGHQDEGRPAVNDVPERRPVGPDKSAARDTGHER